MKTNRKILYTIMNTMHVIMHGKHLLITHKPPNNTKRKHQFMRNRNQSGRHIKNQHNHSVELQQWYKSVRHYTYLTKTGLQNIKNKQNNTCVQLTD